MKFPLDLRFKLFVVAPQISVVDAAGELLLHVKQKAFEPLFEPKVSGFRKAKLNDLDSVKALISDNTVAVMLEPIQGEAGVIPATDDYLRAVRELTRERGVVLIFDEVVTGFRMAPGGAQEYFGVTADLTCLAKAVAGGLPGAALVGRADLMDSIAFSGDAKRDRTKRVADQGTYSGTPLVAAAAVAQLEILKTGEVQRELNRQGDILRAGMNQALKTRGVRGCVYGASSVFRIFLGADAAELGLDNWTMDAARLDRGMGPLAGPLHLAMLINGVDYSRGAAHGGLNGAMTDKDVDLMVDAFDRAVVRLREEKRLP
jgi:glutamate-1-semialdehyde 2,1-aminomutase